MNTEESLQNNTNQENQENQEQNINQSESEAKIDSNTINIRVVSQVIN